MTKFPMDPGPGPAPLACGPLQDIGTYRMQIGFDACPMCNASGQALWNGDWITNPGAPCRWWPDTAPNNRRIGNDPNWRNIHTAHSSLWLDLGGPVGIWRVKVRCELGGFASLDTWTGQKTTGPTAAGIYTRNSGCDAVAQRSFQLVP